MNEERDNLMLPEAPGAENMDGAEAKKEGMDEEKKEEKKEATQADWREMRHEERRRRRSEWRRLRGEMRTRGCINPGRLLIGILVIFFGLTLMAKTMGYFPNGINFDFSQFWPLLVVAFGLSLLDTRRRLYCALSFIVLILVVIFLALSFRNANDAGRGYGSDLLRGGHQQQRGPSEAEYYGPSDSI